MNGMAWLDLKARLSNLRLIDLKIRMKVGRMIFDEDGIYGI